MQSLSRFTCFASIAFSVASCPPKQVFIAANRTSVQVPPEFAQLAPVTAQSHCSLLCALRFGCFGFYWSPSSCHLFNTTAFFRSGLWHLVFPRTNVHVRNFTIARLHAAACAQSSTGYGLVCDKAIDGSTLQTINPGDHCTHTSAGSREWWEAQLSRAALVSTVTIYNRVDCCDERLNKFSLQVDGVQCAKVNRSTPFSIANFSCYGYGSRVRVVSLQVLPVTICEFMIYGFHFP